MVKRSVKRNFKKSIKRNFKKSMRGGQTFTYPGHPETLYTAMHTLQGQTQPINTPPPPPRPPHSFKSRGKLQQILLNRKGYFVGAEPTHEDPQNVFARAQAQGKKRKNKQTKRKRPLKKPSLKKKSSLKKKPSLKKKKK